MEQNLFFQFLVALSLWAFVWLERDLPLKKWWADIEFFGWIRSYALISLFWAITVFLDKNYGFWFFTITWLILISIFILASYIYSCYKYNAIWITTELSWIITYFVWVLVMTWNMEFAVIFTLIITLLLSSKQYIEKAKEKMNKEELMHTLKFCVIAFIVLPLLPDEKYSIVTFLEWIWFSWLDSWTHAILQKPFLNPHSLWFFVVAMSSISYIWYILSKFFTKDSSVILSSIVWWMVSSTAVTATMSEQSKKDPKNYSVYVVWTMLANTIMLARVMWIVLIFNMALLSKIFVPLFLIFIWLLIPTFYFYIKSKKLNSTKEKIVVSEEKLESPFSITPALKFGLFVLFIKFISAVWVIYQDFFWYWWNQLIWVKNIAFYFLWVVSWLADVDAITNDMATKSRDLELSLMVAWMTILFAAMSNNIVKWSIAMKFWEKTFWKNVMFSFIISIVCWITGIFLINF